MENLENHLVKGSILVVDDTPANLRLLVGMLTQRGHEARPAINGKLALSGAQTMPPDLILLDIMMPEMNGYEVCDRLKADENTRDIPVIFISALDETVDKVRAFTVGGVDYISKPFRKEEVLARVESQLRLRFAQKQLQEKNLQLETFSTQLKQLHRLNTTAYQSFAELSADYLRTGCQMLGFSTGIISQIENEAYRIEAVNSDIEFLHPHLEFALGDTYCAEVARTQKTVTYDRVGAMTSLKHHPVYQNLKLESYLGTPIWVNGKFYGTLNFSSTAARTNQFNAHEPELIELMAQSLGKWIGAHQTEMQRQRAQEETQLLLSVTQAISQAPDFESALAFALQQVCEASGWSYGEAWLPSGDGTVLECSPAWYVNCAGAECSSAIAHFRTYSEALNFAPGVGLAGRVWEQGQPEYMQNITAESNEQFARSHLAKDCSIKMGLAVPIVVPPVPEQRQPGRVLAVLIFFLFESLDLQPRQEDERWAELVSSVATQLGTAMQQKQAEAELRALFAAMDDLVLIRDRQGRCLKIAPTNSANWVRSPEEMVGKTLHELLPQATADLLLSAIEDTLDTQQTTQVEYRITAGEREIWLDGRFSPLSAETVLLVARDISDRIKVQSELQQLASELEQRVYERTAQLRTANNILRTEINERIQVQSELAKSEARFRLAVDNIPDIFAIYDREQRYQFVNVEGIRMLGQSLQNLLGRTDAEVFPADVTSAYLPLFEKAMATRTRQTGEFTLDFPGAGKYTLVITYVPLLNEREEIEQILSIAHDITERKQAEKALQAAKEQLQAVLDAVPGFISWIGLNGQPPPRDRNVSEASSLRYLGVNRQLADAFQLDPEAFVGQPIGFLTPNSQFTQFVEHFFQESTPAAAEVINVGVEHAPRNYLIVAQKYQQDTAAVSVGIDITARVQAELQLQQAYQRLQLLSELTLKIRQSLDIEEILQTTVVEVQALLKADRASIVERQTETHGAVVKEAVLPDLPVIQNTHVQFPCFCEEYREQFNEGRAIVFCDVSTDRIVPEDRELLQTFGVRAKLIVPIFTQECLWGCVIVHQCDRPRQWHNDEIELLQQLADQIGIALSQAQLLNHLEERVVERTAELQTTNRQLQQEIAERTKAELALRESEDQLRRAIDNNAYGIVVCTQDEIVRFINPAAELIFGYSAVELLGVNLGISLPDREAGEVVISRPDGSRRIVEMRSVDINWEGKTAHLISLMDITERKAIEQMKDEFLSIASHELRTPLTSIRGSLGLLATGRLGELSEKGRRMLEIAVNNTDRLGRLLNDILDLERMESGKVKMAKKDCDGVELIAHAAEVMQSMADQSNIALCLEVEGREWTGERTPLPLWADPDQILQTLTNLISNSIKFSPSGSTIWLGVASQDSEMLFYIKDQGRGIPADKLDKIFGRFQQVDASDSREKGGTGLGLAICREIVRQHGGKIWVESTMGEGSTFYFALPRNRDEEN